MTSSMGAGELGLNLFHETPETIRIIRRAYKDRALREALFGEGIPHTPHFFVYYATRSFIEEIAVPGWPGGDLAVSHTALDLPLPLRRYRTRDLVRLIPYRRLEEILRRDAPDLPLPVAAHAARQRARLQGRSTSREPLSISRRAIASSCSSRPAADTLLVPERACSASTRLPVSPCWASGPLPRPGRLDGGATVSS